MSRPNRVLPGPPYPHADVEGLWSFIRDGLARFAAAHRVAGVAVTTHGATAALVAGEHLALPVLDYEHDGPDATAEAYDQARPGFAESLSPRLPAGLNLGAQLFWQARAFPDAFARTQAILTYPQFWAWRLSGVLASEATSLGCHTDLWAPAAGRLSSLVEREGWGPTLPAAAAGGFGARADPAGGRGGDRAGARHPGRLRHPRFERLALALARPAGAAVHGDLLGHLDDRDDGRRRADGLDPERDVLANVDAFGRPVPTARFMGGREYAAIAGPDPVPSEPADVQTVIDHGAFALPSFVPGVGPFGGGRGRFEGPVDELAPAARSALADLYQALVARECLSLAGTGARIVVEGPLARNVSACGLIAALAGVPVHPSPDATGTAMGAALLLDPPDAPSGLVPAAEAAPLAVSGLAGYAERWPGWREGRERLPRGLG